MGNMTGERVELQQVQRESLVAVLTIQDDDRKEQWQNCGALFYDLRMPDVRRQTLNARQFSTISHLVE